ncbi:MAG TPA: glycosyltransferase family 2 protein [Kiritimatiellia bacterium]|nr:glycosyltransferase family 2 protein [Kiritimatiellia bacterium]
MPAPIQFSVVTPSWNQGAYLAGCLDSVRVQGRTDLEHIVIDNCSTDGTADILRGCPEIRAIVEPDAGQSEALNKGFALARGEIIAWLNTDDRYLPGTLDCVAEAFRDPAVHVVYGHALLRDETTGIERINRAHFESREDFLVWGRNKLHQPAIFFRRSALESVGPLRTDLHYIMDMELWWRLSGRYAFHFIDAPLAVQVLHAGAKTVRVAHRFVEERCRVFGPLLRRERHWWRLLPERQHNIAWRYLSLASQPGAPRRRLLLRAFLEDPRIAMNGAFWTRVRGGPENGRTQGDAKCLSAS